MLIDSEKLKDWIWSLRTGDTDADVDDALGGVLEHIGQLEAEHSKQDADKVVGHEYLSDLQPCSACQGMGKSYAGMGSLTDCRDCRGTGKRVP